MGEAAFNDRLADLKTSDSVSVTIQRRDDRRTLRKHKTFQRGIRLIQHNTKAVRTLEKRSKECVSSEKHAKVSSYLDEVMIKTRRVSLMLKEIVMNELKDAESQLKRDPNSTSAHIAQNTARSHSKQFTDAMTQFEEYSMSFHRTLKKRITRQAKIVNPDLRDEAVEKLCDTTAAGGGGGVFEMAMVHNGRLDDAIDEIEQQRDAMRQIEEGIMQIRELFEDMEILVDEQQEIFDIIEDNITNVAVTTEKAVKQVYKAEDNMKKARRRQMYMFGMMAMVLFIFACWWGLSSGN